MRFCFLFLLMMLAQPCWAFCPFSTTFLDSLKPETSLSLYNNCAVYMNDDAAQMKLAELYEKGVSSIPKDMKKAIYYYQLSAENGNAEAQARLAQIYMDNDKDRDGRKVLHDYKNAVASSVYHDDNVFKGELVHPYVLLMLANEKEENKWYYPSRVGTPPVYARQLFSTYKITADKKKEMMKHATAWKKRKLLEIAEQILEKGEYEQFVETLYPKVGNPDPFRRSQALKAFKTRVEAYRKQDEESAKAFY